MTITSQFRMSMFAASLIGVTFTSGELVAQQPRPGGPVLPPQATQALPLGEIRNLQIDETRLRAHTMRPAHVEGIVSSKGRTEGLLEFRFPANLLQPHLD